MGHVLFFLPCPTPILTSCWLVSVARSITPGDISLIGNSIIWWSGARRFQIRNPIVAWVLRLDYMAGYPDKSPHYSVFIMGAMASQITSFMIVYATIYTGADQRKHQSVNSPHKRPVTLKMLPFNDVIMLAKATNWWHAPSKENDHILRDSRQACFSKNAQLFPFWIARRKHKISLHFFVTLKWHR